MMLRTVEAALLPELKLQLLPSRLRSVRILRYLLS